VLYAVLLSAVLLSRNDVQGPVRSALRYRAAGRRGAVLRRHRIGVWLAARLLPDPEGDPRRRVGLALGPIGTGFFIAFVFLVVGCFLDAIPAIIIVGTILQPLAAGGHIDPVQFAMIGIVSLAFGLVTPPYGCA
jgi:hypothetical protein